MNLKKEVKEKGHKKRRKIKKEPSEQEGVNQTPLNLLVLPYVSLQKILNNV